MGGRIHDGFRTPIVPPRSPRNPPRPPRSDPPTRRRYRRRANMWRRRSNPKWRMARPGTSRIPAGRTVGIGWPKGRRRSSKPRSRRRRAINPISLLSRRRPHRKPIRCPRKPPVFARLIFARPIFAQWNPIRRSLSNRGTLGESTNRRSRRRTRRWRRRQNSTGWRRAAPSLRKPWNKATPARYRFAIGDAIAHRQIWWTSLHARRKPPQNRGRALLRRHAPLTRRGPAKCFRLAVADSWGGRAQAWHFFRRR